MSATTTDRQTTHRWYRDPAAVALLALGCYVLLYIIWRWAFFSDGDSAAINDVAFLPLYLAASLSAYIVSRDERLDPRVRRAWILLAAASALNWFGDMLWAWYDSVLGTEPFPSWADVAYLAAYPLMVWALMNFTARPRTSGEKVRFWLDSATVMLAAWMVSWYFVLGPTVVEGESDRLTRVLSIAYPVADLVVLFGVIVVLLRRPGRAVVRSLRVLLAAMAITVVADFAFGYLSLNRQSAVRPWLDTLWIVAPFLIVAAAVLQRSFASRRSRERILGLAGRDVVSFLPYSGIVIGYGLLLAVGPGASDYQLAGLLIGAMLMTTIVVSRQIVALHLNAVLLRRSSALAEELRQSEARFRALVQNATDIVVVIDADTTVRYISPSIVRVMGHQPEAVIGDRLLDIVHPDDAPKVRAFVGEALERPGATDATEVRFLHADGSWRHLEAIGANLLDDPSVGGIVVNARDASDRKRLEETLIWQAYHDALTGLPNRRLFLDRLDGALARAQRSGQDVAVLFLDLDNLKEINDGVGHRAGDDVLVAVAARMLEAVRPGDTVARLAGDEFTVLLEGVPGIEEAVTIAGRIEEAITAPTVVGASEVTVSASIGIAITRAGQGTLDDLLRAADLAMYDAKRQGKGRYVIYGDPTGDSPDAEGISGDPAAGAAG